MLPNAFVMEVSSGFGAPGTTSAPFFVTGIAPLDNVLSQFVVISGVTALAFRYVLGNPWGQAIFTACFVVGIITVAGMLLRHYHPAQFQ